ncbi:MAG: helix-turn-helix transcriptional regulator [Marinovum sp.]|nr:helix-turn-helix transcriptional regulator [Marinovum sp.]
MTKAEISVKPDGYFTCPVRRTMSIVGGKWRLLIINSLLDGPMRFNALKRQTGKVSQRLLTAQLRALEEEGLVSRKILNVMPPHVEYALTEKGMGIKTVIDAMYAWGDKELQADNQREATQ